MTDAGWARKVVAEVETETGYVWFGAAMDMVEAEHARSVRIVKAEIKRVKMDQHTYRSEERCLVLGSLETVLNALQRGRGGKG